VNDTYGHQTGDALLKEVADRVTSTIRHTDFASRLGGGMSSQLYSVM